MSNNENPPSIRTSIVIVTYNSATEIEECLAAFQGADGIEVVVVDNASSDSTPQKLQELKHSGHVDILDLSPSNDGFAKAVNKAIGQANGRDILLLNPDARVSAADIDALRAAIKADPELGVVAPVVRNGPHVAVMSAGEQPTLWPLFMHFSGAARAFPRVRAFRGRHLYLKHHANVDQEVGWVSGACMYISRRALDSVGTLSERWFMYGEDIDYCRRVREAGLVVKVLASATAEHSLGASVNAVPDASSPESGRTVSAPSTTSTMWAENTYDYYCYAFGPGPIRQLVWKSIFSSGMYSRALLSTARSLTSSASREPRRVRAAQFRRHAAAVWHRRDISN